MFKVFGLLTLVVSLTAGWLWWDYKVFLDTPMTVPAGGHRVVVEKGSNLTRLTQELKEQQILTHPAYLLWYARWNGLSNIKVGEYVMIHAGFAINPIDEEAAKETEELLVEFLKRAREGSKRNSKL